MGKSVLMSIQPKWVAKILNGEKTIEVRKKFPKDYVGWVYIYNTKTTKDGALRLIYVGNKLEFVLSYGEKTSKYQGKVVGRFWCDKVHDIEVEENDSNGNYSDTYIYCDIQDLEDQSCLDFDDIVEYLWNYDKWGGKGYAIHITRLEVFDTPKLLTMFRKPEFYKNIYDNNGNRLSLFERLRKYPITKAPQSWCYVEV